jgi:hypothetical protein
MSNLLEICGKPTTAKHSKFDYPEVFSGVIPLFTCEYALKKTLCDTCSGKNYERMFEYVRCTCDPDQDYQFIHMFVSVCVNDSIVDKVSTTPKTSIYQINIVNGNYKSYQFEDIRSRIEGNQTIFSIFDTMEIDLNISDILKTTTKMPMDTYSVQTDTSYFYSFKGIANAEIYYNAFSEIFHKYLMYDSKNVKVDAKTNAHFTKKTKKH